jgi:hypothetical protein
MCVQRAQETMDGRFGETETFGELADPKAAGPTGKRLQDPD